MIIMIIMLLLVTMTIMTTMTTMTIMTIMTTMTIMNIQLQLTFQLLTIMKNHTIIMPIPLVQNQMLIQFQLSQTMPI